jgi:hypothetical protein
MKQKIGVRICFALLLSGVFFAGCKRENGTDGHDSSYNGGTNDLPTNTPPPLANQYEETEDTNANERALPQGIVSFERAGISLVPGVEWDSITSGPFAASSLICTPVLKGLGENMGSLIQVFATAGTPDVKTAADLLETNIEANPNTNKGTIKREDFNSIFGINGILVSYDYKSKSSLRADKFRDHVYLFQNAKTNCIAINYITFINEDSVRVQDMIHDTLQLN